MKDASKKEGDDDMEMSAPKPTEEEKRSTAHSRAMEEAKKKRDQVREGDEQLYREHG